jgi:hypothetical protein
VSAPGDLITADGQIEWAGLVLGTGSDYVWDSLDGWEDLPGVDSGNVARPAAHGSWSGAKFAQERTVTFSGFVVSADVLAQVRALRRATQVTGTSAEAPLVVRTAGETLLAYGAITGRAVPLPVTATSEVPVTLQWVCSDPRRYSLVEKSVSLSLSTPPVTGLVYPLVYPLDYGAEDTLPGSSATATNDLDAATPPVVVFAGPITRPRLTNATTGIVLEFDITLDAADTLTVDCAAGTVLLNRAANRLYTATPVCSPLANFVIWPGDTDLELSARDFGPGNTATVTWRDATL